MDIVIVLIGAVLILGSTIYIACEEKFTKPASICLSIGVILLAYLFIAQSAVEYRYVEKNMPLYEIATDKGSVIHVFYTDDAIMSYEGIMGCSPSSDQQTIRVRRQYSTWKLGVYCVVTKNNKYIFPDKQESF